MLPTHNTTVAYRRWISGHVDYTKDVSKTTEVICVSCHDVSPDNDERDSGIVLRSKNGATIVSTNPKCAECGKPIKPEL